MQITFECDPVILENVINQNIAESSDLEANVSDNLQEKSGKFHVTL